MVLDVLRLLAKGSDAAKEAGEKLLSGMPLALWRRVSVTVRRWRCQ